MSYGPDKCGEGEPYITTENFNIEGDRRGHLHLKHYRFSGPHLIFVDVVAHNVNGDEIILERIELGKLETLCQEARAYLNGETKS